jgi:hypothetical protein
MLVQNGLVSELNKNKLVQLQAQKTVQTQSFLYGNDELKFANLYNFSRTATSVLRMFMLEASGMRVYYDPNFSTKQKNRENFVLTIWPESRSIQMAREERSSRRLSAEFDRLFPHCVIEYQLRDIDLGRPVKLSGQMYVIYFPSPTSGGRIYYINATMDVKKAGMEIHASVHVAVTEYSFSEPVITSSNGNESEFRRLKLVKELIEEWEPSQDPNVVGDLPPMLENLSLN